MVFNILLCIPLLEELSVLPILQRTALSAQSSEITSLQLKEMLSNGL